MAQLDAIQTLFIEIEWDNLPPYEKQLYTLILPSPESDLSIDVLSRLNTNDGIVWDTNSMGDKRNFSYRGVPITFRGGIDKPELIILESTRVRDLPWNEVE